VVVGGANSGLSLAQPGPAKASNVPVRLNVPVLRVPVADVGFIGIRIGIGIGAPLLFAESGSRGSVRSLRRRRVPRGTRIGIGDPAANALVAAYADAVRVCRRLMNRSVRRQSAAGFPQPDRGRELFAVVAGEQAERGLVGVQVLPARFDSVRGLAGQRWFPRSVRGSGSPASGRLSGKITRSPRD
jgi:hypothetical protein